MGDQTFDHAQNGYLGSILRMNQKIVTLSKSNLDLSEFVDAAVQLQNDVNALFDSSKNTAAKGNAAPAGIKQILEKKEGLFRQNMMGKRVNYAARSVISPDPNIETSEIGIPMVFASKLTYPEPVTNTNVHELRKNVINGPEEYPGATYIQNEDGSMISLENFNRDKRIALANQLLTPSSSSLANTNESFLNKKVFRHLKDGDVLLVNRKFGC
jgi:DNA-directed RNA polymerase I subunit RPA1